MGSSLVIRLSLSPEAASEFSLMFGMCCLKTSGVSLRGPRRLPPPRPGPHAIAGRNKHKHASTKTTRADNFMSAHTTSCHSRTHDVSTHYYTHQHAPLCKTPDYQLPTSTLSIFNLFGEIQSTVHVIPPELSCFVIRYFFRNKNDSNH